MKTYWTERINPADIKIVRSFCHQLTLDERKYKKQLMREQVSIDINWGFMESGMVAWCKRMIYIRLIHRFLKRNPGW